MATLLSYHVLSVYEVWILKRLFISDSLEGVDALAELILMFATCGRPLEGLPLKKDGNVSIWVPSNNLSYDRWCHYLLYGVGHKCVEYSWFPMSIKESTYKKKVLFLCKRMKKKRCSMQHACEKKREYSP